MVKASLDLALGCGAVVAVPIPPEHEAAGREVEAAIREALAEADRRGVAGAQVQGVGGARQAGPTAARR
jgi:pseudouridine-5'-phosphate glycosidase